jgi:HD-like signal output (HDOD) protein/CheY-like chemotaxis protein
VRRLLFVDDEERILDGLRTLLRHKRKEWDMVFALGSDQALEKLHAGRFDAVVSDMRMPKMDGAQLLAYARELQPETVRIVLSGHSDPGASMRALSVAHQYLSKPCDPKLLEETVERAIDLQALIAEGRVRRAVGMLDQLPSLPSTYTELTAALNDERTTADDVAKIVERDMAMSAKLLQIVGSAFFRTPRSFTSTTQAIAYLGFAMVKNLVLLNGIFSGERCPEVAGFSVEELQRHALRTARFASRVMDDRTGKEHAFLAGVVHDIGQLVLAMKMPLELAEVLEVARREGRPLHEVEEERWGVTHAEISAYLLGIWGLPFPVVEATASHHHPSRVAGTEFNLVAALHVADVLTASPHQHHQLDRAYLEQIGVADRIDRWVDMAGEDHG